jgi:hypothetical protein
VELDCLADELPHLIDGFRGCDTAGQVWYVRAVTGHRLFENYCATHPYSSLWICAGRNTLASVFGGTSSARLPATMTVPGFDAMMELPLTASCTHQKAAVGFDQQD